MGDHGYLQHSCGPTGPFRTEKVPVRPEEGGRYSARYAGCWCLVHSNQSGHFIVFQGARITIQVEGV